MDGNDKYWFHKDPNGLLVRAAPLDWPRKSTCRPTCATW